MPPAYRIMLESKSIRIKINDRDFEAINITGMFAEQRG
jgi:hypothetical protein